MLSERERERERESSGKNIIGKVAKQWLRRSMMTKDGQIKLSERKRVGN